MQFIETHAHIYAEEFDLDREEVILRAKSNFVTKIFMPNVDSQSILPMLACEAKYPEICVPTIGLHPSYVDENYLSQLSIIEEWLQRRKFAAIGEVGIDLHHDKTFSTQQEIVFEIQCKWAIQYNLPLIIHSRSAFYEVIKIIKKFSSGSLNGIFHCFGGSIQDAEAAINLGFLLGIGGTVTYKNSGLKEIMTHISLDHIVLETDCPYLPPVPHRGKRNEPSYLTLIATQIAEIKNISLEDVSNYTTKNALSLFKNVP